MNGDRSDRYENMKKIIKITINGQNEYSKNVVKYFNN
jgi:hypothetical protein